MNDWKWLVSPRDNYIDSLLLGKEKSAIKLGFI